MLGGDIGRCPVPASIAARSIEDRAIT